MIMNKYESSWYYVQSILSILLGVGAVTSLLIPSLRGWTTILFIAFLIEIGYSQFIFPRLLENKVKEVTKQERRKG